MDWYYTQNGSQSGPVSSSDLQDLIDRGQVSSAALVWREGLAEWQPVASTGQFRLPGAAAGALVAPQAISQPAAAVNPYQPGAASSFRGGYDSGPWQGLIQNAGWIKLFGVMMMIMGILYAIGLIGIPYIFIGLALLNAAKNLRLLGSQPSVEAARAAADELGKSFKIMGIMTIIGMVLMVLYLVFVFIAIGIAASQGASLF